MLSAHGMQASNFVYFDSRIPARAQPANWLTGKAFLIFP